MTNEQLAMLLNGYVTRLTGIIGDLANGLAEVDVEREAQVQFEVNSEAPAEQRGGFVFFKGCTVSATEVLTGDPVMLQSLKDFREELVEAVGILLGCDED